MSTIVISILPELGHINSPLKLAKSLMARGHDVYILGGGADYKSYSQTEGLRYITLGESVGDVFNTRPLMREWLEGRLLCRPLDQRLTRVVEICRREIDGLVRNLRPDLFMIDPFMPEIPLIAHELGVPYVFLNNALFNPLDDTPLAHTAPYLSHVPELILCPQEFDFPEPQGRGKRKLYYLGAEVDLQRHEEMFDWSRIDPDKRLIYCSFGSMPEVYPNLERFFQRIIEAVRNLPQYQLVLKTGPNFAHEGFKNVPANALLLRRAPQLGILQRTSIFIMHGGLNGIKEALCYGVPMIVFPSAHDQPMNAARVAYHRLGVTGDALTMAVDQARAMIQKVGETDLYRERANHFRNIIRRYEEAQVSAMVVEAFLQRLASKPRMTVLAADARG
jgi:Glycosyl transferases, related to UDP-glucuronosyltransferase